jgi:hypothetical protein
LRDEFNHTVFECVHKNVSQEEVESIIEIKVYRSLAKIKREARKPPHKKFIAVCDYAAGLMKRVKNVNSTSVSMSAKPNSNIVKIRPPAPGLRAVPSQAAAMALPSAIAPPKAAMATAKAGAAGMNHDWLVAAVVPSAAAAVATVTNIINADMKNNLALIIELSS